MKKLFILPLAALAVAAACSDNPTAVPVSAPETPLKDLISSDIAIVAGVKTMSLAAGGATGTTTLSVTPTNGDGKSGCNLTGSTTLVVSVNSSDAAKATVSPESITFESCEDTHTLTVTPVAAGSATISLGQISNSTAGTFDLAPATFTVNVAAASVTSYQLSVTKSGAGTGTVSGTGIDCGTDCSESYTSGTEVTLTATPGATSTFNGWSGACTNASGTCVVTMNEAKSVNALFKANQTITFTSAVPSPVYHGDSYTPTATGGGSNNSIVFGASGACTWDAANGEVDFVGFGTCTVTADQAGNADYNVAPQATQIITVTAWTLTGFYQPVNPTALNTVKGGSTVPLKFEIFAGETELTSTSAIKSFVVKTINCTTASGLGEDPIDQVSTGGTSLRYDTTAGQFVQNWQTGKTAGTCYLVTMTTQDGSSIFANFKTK